MDDFEAADFTEQGADDAAISEALGVLGDVGISADAVGIDLGEQEEQQEAPPERVPTHQQTDEFRRQKWSQRQEQRNQELDAYRSAFPQLQNQLAAIQQQLANQQRPQQQTQAERDRYDNLDPQFRAYMEEQLQRQHQATLQQQQQMLAPLLQRMQYEDQVRQAEMQSQQRNQAIEGQARRIMQDIQEYRQENPEFHDLDVMYQQSMASGLKRLGLDDNAVNQIMTANAFGMAHLAGQLGVNPGLLSHMIIEEFMAAAVGAGGRRGMATQQGVANRNAAALARPNASGNRRGGAASVTDQIRAKGGVSRTDITKLASARPGRLAATLATLGAKLEAEE